jgi:Ca2+-transporting ATPase
LYNVLLKEGLEIARTTVFTSLVVAEIGLVLTMRSETKHFWELPRNRWLLPGLAIAILLQLIVIYTPLREVFDTVFLDARHWALSLIVPIAIILVDALRKSLKIKL